MRQVGGGVFANPVRERAATLGSISIENNELGLTEDFVAPETRP
jgi:hypothetical protein